MECKVEILLSHNTDKYPPAIITTLENYILSLLDLWYGRNLVIIHMMFLEMAKDHKDWLGSAVAQLVVSGQNLKIKKVMPFW